MATTNTKTGRGTGIKIVNNAGDAGVDWHDAILDAILAGGVLPEELADVLTLTRYVAPDGDVRWILDYA